MTPAPAKLDIRFDRNCDFALDLQLLQEDETTPVNLTGSTFAAAVKEPFGEVELLEITCTVTDAAEGELTLSVAAADLDDLAAWCRGKWDLLQTDSLGKVTKIMEGWAVLESTNAPT